MKSITIKSLLYRPFGDINYGFALPRKSPYTHKFSVAMLQLQQEGFLERMTEKWFRSRSVCSAETQAAQATAEKGGDQLRFIDMAGVFITLAVGIVAGMVVLLAELIYASYKDTKSKDSMVSYVSLLAAFYFIVFSYLATFECEWSIPDVMGSVPTVVRVSSVHVWIQFCQGPMLRYMYRASPFNRLFFRFPVPRGQLFYCVRRRKT